VQAVRSPQVLPLLAKRIREPRHQRTFQALPRCSGGAACGAAIYNRAALL
jgi:hypothetical protein